MRTKNLFVLIHIRNKGDWGTDLNKSSRLLSESQFTNSVIDKYVCSCLYTCKEFIK